MLTAISIIFLLTDGSMFAGALEDSCPSSGFTGARILSKETASEGLSIRTGQGHLRKQLDCDVSKKTFFEGVLSGCRLDHQIVLSAYGLFNNFYCRISEFEKNFYLLF